jgi:hypothetical protein
VSLPSPAPARRALLAALGVGIAAGCTAPAVVPATKLAGGATKPTPRPTPKPTPKATPTPAKSSSPAPVPATSLPPTPTAPAGASVPNMVGTDPAWHLLRRATFGPTPALVAEVKTLGWDLKTVDDREVIRKNALGAFSDMLRASAKTPAMLRYLANADSSVDTLNENYGRELLELHTVGLIYSETDVKEASKLLTGRTVDDHSNYIYRSGDHYTGVVRVLGFAHANASVGDGEPAGDALITYLARHPATAQRLARMMCVRYVSDTPSSALVTAVANAYLASGTKIVPMLATILHSTEFWQSRGAKVRRPTENLVATVRTLAPRVSDMAKALDSLSWMSSNVGHAPLEWPSPDGYPDVAISWRSSGTLISLWKLHIGFAGDWWDGFAPSDKRALYGGTPATSGQAITLLTRRLTGMTFAPAHQAALQTFVGESASTPMAISQLRWVLVPLIGIILDGPHHALR